MTMQEQIETKLRSALAPVHLDVVNESHMHSVPPGSESHFNVVVVSDRFAGKALVLRHRQVNEILAAELGGGIHALALHTMTAEEWERRAGAAASPACLSGSRAEK